MLYLWSMIGHPREPKFQAWSPDEETHAAAAAAKSLQSCPTLRSHRRQPTRLPRPWYSPGKNTGVGCHFLLQCMKVKSESEVAQSCPTLRDPMNWSLPGSSVHGILQARVLEWGAITFSNLSGQWILMCLITNTMQRQVLKSWENPSTLYTIKMIQNVCNK